MPTSSEPEDEDDCEPLFITAECISESESDNEDDEYNSDDDDDDCPTQNSEYSNPYEDSKYESMQHNRENDNTPENFSSGNPCFAQAEIYAQRGSSYMPPVEKPKDVCGITSFFKGIKNLYPRCSYLRFFKGLKYCEKDSDKNTQLDCKYDSPKKDGCPFYGNEYKSNPFYRGSSGYPYHSKNNSYQYYYKNDGNQCCSKNESCRSHRENQPCCKKNYAQSPCSPRKSSYPVGCNCYKVYTQLQVPLNMKPKSDDSLGNESSESSETESQKKIKSYNGYISRKVRPDQEFIFPYKTSQIYYTEEQVEEEHEESDKKKHKKNDKEKKEKKVCGGGGSGKSGGKGKKVKIK